VKICDWAMSEGHSNKRDRCYFQAPKDVCNIKRRLKALSVLDVKDNTSVEKLVNSDLKDNILIYHPLCNVSKQHLMIVVQRKWTKQQLQENPLPMVFLDATNLWLAFYAILTIKHSGRGLPIACLILRKQLTL
jgi:hypothetical protein